MIALLRGQRLHLGVQAQTEVTIGRGSEGRGGPLQEPRKVRIIQSAAVADEQQRVANAQAAEHRLGMLVSRDVFVGVQAQHDRLGLVPPAVQMQHGVCGLAPQPAFYRGLFLPGDVRSPGDFFDEAVVVGGCDQDRQPVKGLDHRAVLRSQGPDRVLQPAMKLA